MLKLLLTNILHQILKYLRPRIICMHNLFLTKQLVSSKDMVRILNAVCNITNWLHKDIFCQKYYFYVGELGLKYFSRHVAYLYVMLFRKIIILKPIYD